MINILLVDDHLLFTEGVKSMFATQAGARVTHSTHNGYEVPELLTKHPIDVILLDISMPFLDGPGVLQLLQEHNLSTPAIMLTMHTHLSEVRKSLNFGASGYILKDALLPELMEAITTVTQGGTYFHQKIQSQMINYFRGKKATDQSKRELSRRELEIIRELATGGSSKEIAERLFLSEHTVRTHRRNILLKLEVANTAELVHVAMENGWI